ncbi:MAG: 2OG-Fe(II) oxygenase [Hyphomicrobiales bacterium]|nr:2OG-Fe(II) oxygenase [Hyphomicrobiales bacterium]
MPLEGARVPSGGASEQRPPRLASLPAPSGLAARLASIDWERIGAELDGFGAATTGPLLTPQECAHIASGYAEEKGFRSRVVMSRHGFGRGEYKYYAYPLPDLIVELRTALYPPLAAVANRWEASLGRGGDYPRGHAAYLERCHAAGQRRPTPLLLRYEAGDYNCLHQDLYGALAFPLQVAFLLSAPGEHFTGGQFVLTEQRPRMQSRAEVVSLRQGEGVIFAVNQRPVQGGRGVYRVTMRHGVSRLRSGERFTLGIIFHDAA